MPRDTPQHLGLDLSPAQREAALHLATSALRLYQVAEKVGVDRGTLRDWMQQPAFQSYLEELLLEVRGETARTLLRARERAARTLEEALDDDDARVRISAAKALGEFEA